MPIYEYHCAACGHESEVFQRLSDPDETRCPACQSDQWRRLVSAAGFRLKGGGWYETDFKSGNKRNVIGSESKSEPGASGASADSGSSEAGKSGKAEGGAPKAAA